LILKKKLSLLKKNTIVLIKKKTLFIIHDCNLVFQRRCPCHLRCLSQSQRCPCHQRRLSQSQRQTHHREDLHISPPIHTDLLPPTQTIGNHQIDTARDISGSSASAAQNHQQQPPINPSQPAPTGGSPQQRQHNRSSSAIVHSAIAFSNHNRSLMPAAVNPRRWQRLNQCHPLRAINRSSSATAPSVVALNRQPQTEQYNRPVATTTFNRLQLSSPSTITPRRQQ